MKKLLSLALALLMLAVMLPVVSMAAGLSGDVKYPDGITKDSFGTNTIYVDNVTGEEHYFAKLEDALNAASARATMYCLENATIASNLNHPDFYKDITVYGNGADFQKRENNFGTVGSGYKYPDANTTVTVTVYNAKNFAVWGQPSNDSVTWNVTLKNCENDGKYFLMFRNEANFNSTMNFTLEDCKLTGTQTTSDNGLHITAGGSVTVTGCTFTNCSVPINVNHKQNNALTINISGNTFDHCGLDNPSDDYYAPVRIVNAAEGTSVNATIKNNTFTNTVAKGSNGDIRLGDQRTENDAPKPSYDVSATIETNQVITVKSGNASIPPMDPATVSAGSKVTADAKGNITPVKEEGPSQIVIISPTQDTPKTDDQKNPTTGANDLVAVAVAAAALALAGSAIILRKD